MRISKIFIPLHLKIIFLRLLQLYIEGYLQAMLHVTYNQEYLQVKVIDNLVSSLTLY